MVASRVEAPSELMFLPYLYGGPDGAPGGFVGMQARHERADLVHAVYEGIVFAHKRHVDRLVGAGDTPPECVRLAGGGARSEVWAQMFADTLGVPVEIAGGSEFGAFGASLCAAVGIGHHADCARAVEAMVKVAKRFEPNASRTDRQAERFERFERIGAALASASA